MDKNTQETNLPDQQQLPEDVRRTTIMQRVQMYRMVYLFTGVVAVLVYYGLPALSLISHQTAERWVMLVAVPYFFFNAFVALRWLDVIVQSLAYMQAEHKGYYNFFRVSTFGLPVYKKPWIQLGGILWIVIGISAILMFLFFHPVAPISR